MIIGAPGNYGSSGASYLVFGKDSGFDAAISLSNLDSNKGFRLDGVGPGKPYSNQSVSTAGDVNSDGFDDLIIGAYWADPNGIDSGSTYVVFGRSDFTSGNVIKGISRDDILKGTSGANTFEALGGNDTMLGYGGADILNAVAGNDTLKGGTGADTMNGGARNDIYFVDNIEDKVIEKVKQGKDQVSSSITYTVSANVENLTLTGTSTINGTGNGLANVITAITRLIN